MINDKNDSYIDYTNQQNIFDHEIKHIQSRKDRDQKKDNKIYGLALSGGGIRSASFALGVMQAFAKRNKLKKFDYLSTVSGGGYIGSSLSWFLHKKWQYGGDVDNPIQFGVAADNFPFGTKPNQEKEEPGAGSREKMSILRHLRQNLNYLFPGDGIGPAALFSAIIRGFIINVVVYGPVLLFLLACIAYFATNGLNVDALKGITSIKVIESKIEMQTLSVFLNLGLLLVGINLTLSVLYGGLCSFLKTQADVLYRVHRKFLKYTGMIWMFALVSLVIGSLPAASEMLSGLFSESNVENSAAITLSGIVSGIWGFIRTGSGKKPTIKIPTGLIISVAAGLLIYGILLLSYDILAGIFAGSWEIVNNLPDVDIYYFLLILPALMGMFININYVTIHGYYRDRLMELFMPAADKTTINKPAHAAHQANLKLLQDICRYDKEAVGPYHLINTNIVLPGSRITKFRGRGGDSFLLSPLYCGSSATGWRKTDCFNNGKMTLASAMSISGAAVNPSTGSNGQGATRNYFLSIIMSVLNLRLGVWVENPRTRITLAKPQPNLWVPGLYDGLMSHSLDEESAYIQLSDGGHFENLAAYELIRRKVGVIVVCDGAADKDYSFADFTNLVEKVRLDFGAVIHIDLDPLIPVKGESYPYGLEELAEQGYAIGTVTYNDGSTAHIVYMKTTIIAGLPADIYGYKLQHDDYPDESTGDQVFNEKQFEAYRELGYQICKSMLNSRTSIARKLFDH